MSTALSYAVNGFGLFAVGSVALFTALAHAPTAPFFWHPISMALSFVLFMSQGVLVLMSKNSLLQTTFELAERKIKIEAHYWLQVSATTSYTIGFISIIYNKYAKGSNHFTTWHSWIGLLCGAVCYSQLLLGLYLYYTWPKSVLNTVLGGQKPKDLTMKRWHRTLAVIGFLTGILTCIVAMWSSFVVKNFPTEVSTMLLVAFIVVGASTSLIGLRVELPEWLQ